MEQAVEQHCVKKNKFQDKMKEILKENERLLEQAIRTNIENIDVNANVNYACKTMNECERYVIIETELQKKDTIIMKLKERIRSLSGNLKEEKTKRELKEIEMINIELDHRVTKLVDKNEHLKQTYNLQEKVLVITALKDTLSKLKGKVVLNEAVPLHPIDLELLKIYVALLAPKLRNNRTTHYDYLKHTQEETATLREIVENKRLLNPLNNFLDYAAVATACYTQNRSIIRLRYEKTPDELLHNKILDLSFLYVFGALCYPTNDSGNLGKLQPKADIWIFIGYATTKKAFWVYNRRTRRIVATIYVDSDELTAMAFEHGSSGPARNEMTPAIISLGLVQKPSSSTPYVPPSRNDWDLLFQMLFDELLTPPPSVDHQAP
uniref:Retroviral polymerase SH3-like domain-containing protein n=1 Tax=Tanacetum cinerariifolium TaxID=118510 RepID=A0A6L2P720_TANCI|nr:hypothetical protein [Tanacetum cinerariifolium]